MFCMPKTKKYILAYISKHNSSQITLLMILNGEGWHYLADKKLSVLLRGTTLKHHGDFYCLNCLHSFATENKPESHKNYVKVKILVT